jgi:hypothetical protein
MFNFRRSGANGAVAVSVHQRMSRTLGVLLLVMSGVVAVHVASPIATGGDGPGTPDTLTCRDHVPGAPCAAWAACRCCLLHLISGGFQCGPNTCYHNILVDQSVGTVIERPTGYGPILWTPNPTPKVCKFKPAYCMGWPTYECWVSDIEEELNCIDLIDPGTPYDCP